jgi:hypothetical protein
MPVMRFCAASLQVFVTLPEAARAILNNNGPDSFKMVLHPSGQLILGDNNIGMYICFHSPATSACAR